MPKKRMRSRDEEPENVADSGELALTEDGAVEEPVETDNIPETEAELAEDQDGDDQVGDDQHGDDQHGAVADVADEDEVPEADEASEADEADSGDSAESDDGESSGDIAAGTAAMKRRTRPEKPQKQPRRASWANRLYTGESGFDFVGKRKIT